MILSSVTEAGAWYLAHSLQVSLGWRLKPGTLDNRGGVEWHAVFGVFTRDGSNDVRIVEEILDRIEKVAFSWDCLSYGVAVSRHIRVEGEYSRDGRAT